jgi:hypothetical protein
MIYTVWIKLVDDSGKEFNIEFDSRKYSDPRNCILDAQVWINKKVCYEAMEPQAFRDYCRSRKPKTNWKHEEVGAGEG